MFVINVAELNIGIQNRYDFVQQICRDFLADHSASVDFTVSVTQEDIVRRQDRAKALGRRVYPLWYYESEAIHRELCRNLPAWNGIFLHSAALSLDGAGVGLVAGVHGGKTTQLRLWQRQFGQRVTVINGDKPIYRKREDGRFWVFGTPWKGKEALGSGEKAPLRALFFLRKAERCELVPMEREAVLAEIFHHLELPGTEEKAGPISRVLAELLAEIPCYALSCDQSVRAACLAEEALRSGGLLP